MVRLNEFFIFLLLFCIFQLSYNGMYSFDNIKHLFWNSLIEKEKNLILEDKTVKFSSQGLPSVFFCTWNLQYPAHSLKSPPPSLGPLCSALGFECLRLLNLACKNSDQALLCSFFVGGAWQELEMPSARRDFRKHLVQSSYSTAKFPDIISSLYFFIRVQFLILQGPPH